mgnify:CR=1 FL=1
METSPVDYSSLLSDALGTYANHLRKEEDSINETSRFGYLQPRSQEAMTQIRQKLQDLSNEESLATRLHSTIKGMKKKQKRDFNRNFAKSLSLPV